MIMAAHGADLDVSARTWRTHVKSELAGDAAGLADRRSCCQTGCQAVVANCNYPLCTASACHEAGWELPKHEDELLVDESCTWILQAK